MEEPTITGLILTKLYDLEKKIDNITIVSLPKVVTDVAVMKTEAIVEARTTSRIHGSIWGVITLLISLVGVAVAFIKH